MELGEPPTPDRFRAVRRYAVSSGRPLYDGTGDGRRKPLQFMSGGFATHIRPGWATERAAFDQGVRQMFTLFFTACVLWAIVMAGAVIRMVVRDDRISKEISQEGNDFLARWRG